jgi:membrane fusion protein, multidrug efflux system
VKAESKNTMIGIVVTVLLIVGAYSIWKIYFSKKPVEVVQEVAAIPVPAVTVVSKTLFREDQLPGEIHAYQDVLVYPKVPGFVQWIGVDRGSVVKKGELMATMYAPEYLASRNEAYSRVASAQAAVASAESRLQSTQADLEHRRANLLADESTNERIKAASLVPGVIANNDVVQWAQTVEMDRQDIDSSIKKVNAIDHEVIALKKTLVAEEKAYTNFADFASYLRIPAPFNGYITERDMHVGSFSGPLGSGAYPPICRIQQLDLLRIVAPVPERDTDGILMGTKVQFTVSSFPGKRFDGIVARLANSLDRPTRTMPVELNFFNPDYKVLPGMFCEVYWPTRRRESSLFVPISAVVTSPLTTFVCRIQENTIEWVTVKKGQVMNGMVEVFGNIHEGEVVAREGNEELVNGTKVTPTDLKPTQEEKGPAKKREPYHFNSE